MQLLFPFALENAFPISILESILNGEDYDWLGIETVLYEKPYWIYEGKNSNNTNVKEWWTRRVNVVIKDKIRFPSKLFLIEGYENVNSESNESTHISITYPNDSLLKNQVLSPMFLLDPRIKSYEEQISLPECKIIYPSMEIIPCSLLGDNS